MTIWYWLDVCNHLSTTWKLRGWNLPPSGNLVDWLASPESHCISIALLFYCIYIALSLYCNNVNMFECIVLHCIWFPWHYSPKMNALLSISDQYKTTSAINAHTVHCNLHCISLRREGCIEVLLFRVQCNVFTRTAQNCTVHCSACSLPCSLVKFSEVWYRVIWCSNTLQCTYVHCSALLCIAVHCSLPGWLGMYPGAAGFHH